MSAKPELTIRLSLCLAYVVRKHLTYAIDEVKKHEPQLSPHVAALNMVTQAFLDRLRAPGRSAHQSKSATFVFSFGGLNRRLGAFSPHEAKVMRAAFQHYLDKTHYAHPGTYPASQRRVRLLDEWLGISVVERLASLDPDRTGLVVA